MASMVVEKRNEFEAKQKELADIFEQAGGMAVMDLEKVTAIEGDPPAKAAEIQRRNTELNELRKEVELYEGIARSAKENEEREKWLYEPNYPKGFHGNGRQGMEEKSLGQLVVESDAFKNYSKGVGPTSSIKDRDIKALFRTGAGWEPETTRTGRVVLDAQRPVQVLDIIPQIPTGQASIVYMEETTFTNAAVETGETTNPAQATPTAAQGGYQESALALTERTSPVRLIATILPVTDVQLEDVAGIEAYINQRLTFMLQQRLDGQVLVGNGTAPNLTGIANVSGVNTEVKAADDPAPSTVYKALTASRVTGRAMPSAVVMHPTDWQNIRLLQDANGNYIMGPPGLMIENRLWGYPVVESDALTAGQFIAGDFNNFCAIHDRRDVDIQITNSHSDYFMRGVQAIRADVRAAFVVYRPAAFTLGSGL